MAILSAADQSRTYYHLGYLQVQPAASLSFGIPRPIQTVFLVQTAITNLIQEAVPRVLSILSIMDNVESKLVQAQTRLAALQIEELKLNPEEPDLLEKEYVRWALRLADILGVPLYPFSTRFKGAAGVSSGSIRVRNS